MKKTKILLPIMLFALCSCGKTNNKEEGTAIEYDAGVKLLQNCVNNVDTFDAIGFNANLEKLYLHATSDTYEVDTDDKKIGESTITDLVEASINGEFDVAASGLTSATTFDALKASIKASLNADVKYSGKSILSEDGKPVDVSAQAVLDQANVYVDINDQLKSTLAGFNVELPEKFYLPLPTDAVKLPLFSDDLIENAIASAKEEIKNYINETSLGFTSEQIEQLTQTLESTFPSFISFKEYSGEKYEVSVTINKTNLTAATNTIARKVVELIYGYTASTSASESNEISQMIDSLVSGITANVTPYFDGIDHINLSAMFSKEAFLNAAVDIDFKIKMGSISGSSTADEVTVKTTTDFYLDLKLKTSTTLTFGEDVNVIAIANKEDYTLIDLNGDSGNENNE